jgi:hypothetical protein
MWITNSVLLLCLTGKVWGKVGFEVEMGQYRVTYTNEPDLIPRKTVLYQSPSHLWNLTVDVVEGLHGYENDLEVVTVPFDYFHENGYKQLKKVKLSITTGRCHQTKLYVAKAIKEVSKFLSYTRKQVIAASKANIETFTIPDYVSPNDFTMTWNSTPVPADVLHISPQLTFGILPSHFHHLVCEFLQQDSEQAKHARTMFLHEHSVFAVKKACEDMAEMFDTHWFSQVFAQDFW